MKVFVLNRGSSTIKAYLYEFNAPPNHAVDAIWETQVETTTSQALMQLLKMCPSNQVDVIGHRIVHGGNYFRKSVRITPDVKEKIKQLGELAPLHNISELEGIDFCEQVFKGVPQIAVFDTAFHHTLPEATQIYPGPYSWYEKGILRYGFHGISHQYCARRVEALLNRDRLKMVICHLGSGASLSAVKDGKSIDTTMGFTPLDGLMMSTRSGSIDPGIILHLLKKQTPEEIFQELYKASGLLGVSGISSDMRVIVEESAKGNARASLAFNVYIHRLNSLIGSMIASLQGLDALIFTAGIGENAPLVRERVCDTFSFLGIQLDKQKNQQNPKEDLELTTLDSNIKVFVIHTQESFEIARECWKNLEKD